MMMKMSAMTLFGFAAATETSVNPIRKVVTLLQEMQKEVTAEGEKESDLMQKFNCYCKNGSGDLQKQIEEGNAANAESTAAMEEASAQKKQAEEDLANAKTGRAEAKATLAKATAIREKENKAFVALTGELTEDLAAMNSAIKALEKGMTGFLQTSTGAKLRSIMENRAESLDVDDKETLASFLQGDYVPQSGQIVGILKNMVDVMAGDNADEIAKEKEAVASFAELKAAKTKEIGALTEVIEKKTKQAGELAVKIVETKNAAEDAAESAKDNAEFAANLGKACEEKNAQFDERQKVRADEVVAISKAIAILNEDDALDLFKKTMKSPEVPKEAAFMQVRSTKENKVAKVVAMLAKKSSSPTVALMQNTLKSQIKAGKVDFSKVLKMIDDMVVILQKEQVDDEDEKKYCETELDTSDDKKKALTRTAGEQKTKITELDDTIKTLAEQISTLQSEIASLDKEVAEASEQRKAEHSEYSQVMTDNTLAKELIGKAKNRLNKFYNPDMYVRSEEEKRVGETMGDKMAREGAQFTSFIQLGQPGPAPETFEGSYSGKGQKSNSVIALMDMLIKELDTDMQEAEHEEKTAQEDYEELMKESATSKADKSKTITDKEAAKADAEGNLADTKEGLSMTVKELKANADYIANLHNQCDFLLANFGTRKEARTSEIEGLKNAKAVLSGASYSLF